MWYCPKCGEPIDDLFDACWKCGTAQNGAEATDFHAEPCDVDAGDLGPEPEPATEIAEHFDAASGDARNERIVELCSAANAVAAYAFRDLLEEAGIRCRVVGELLGNAAGALPLGETLAPRIWVREQDAARAREIINERISSPCQQLSSSAKCDEPSELDADSEGESAPRVPDVRFRWLSRGFLIVGVACISLGSVWTWSAWMMKRQYAATTEGVAVRCKQHFSHYFPPPPEIPFPRESPTFSVWYDVQYAFVVDGKTYYAVDRNCREVVSRSPIHYDPHHPARNVVGSLMSPWLVLEFALGIGGLLLLFGYYLASTRREAGSSK